MREKITECPISSDCDCNCFDPTVPQECKDYYTQEEVLRYLSFVLGYAPQLLEDEIQTQKEK